MLNEPTQDQLRALRLHAMANAWTAQHRQSQFADLGFDERFGLLVDAQWLYRENRRLTRLLTDAKLKMNQATVEDIDFPARRELDRAVVRQLATGRWVQEHQNLLISGATGTGKTFVACAFAQLACRHGYRVLYRRASRLFDELTLAHADGTYPRLLGRLARLDVLVIDDFGLAPLDEQQRRDLHEILDDRYGLRSTIIASQLLTKQWHMHIGEPTLADAICDRLFHNAHKLVLKGPSRRKPEGTD
ncbi:MAG: IS21-like element helper ATPase IstB [Candidatus Binatia bacterium]